MTQPMDWNAESRAHVQKPATRADCRANCTLSGVPFRGEMEILTRYTQLDNLSPAA